MIPKSVLPVGILLLISGCCQSSFLCLKWGVLRHLKLSMPLAMTSLSILPLFTGLQSSMPYPTPVPHTQLYPDFFYLFVEVSF